MGVSGVHRSLGSSSFGEFQLCSGEPGGFKGQGEKAREERPQSQGGMRGISLPVFTSHFFLGLRLAEASAELLDVY